MFNFKNFTPKRALYAGVGAWIVVQSLIDGFMPGALMGAWFLAMGVMGWGCAGDACQIPDTQNRPVKRHNQKPAVEHADDLR
jgi:hypothetical protein